jgi:hypothetical protein
MYRVKGESSGFRDVLGESLTVGSIVRYTVNGTNNFGKIINENDNDWVIDNKTNNKVILTDYSVTNLQILKCD